MKIALVQTTMGVSPDQTIPRAQEMLTRALTEGDRPDLLILPEYFSFYGTSTQTARALARPLEETEGYRMAQEFARSHRVNVQAGTILAKVPGDERVENVSVVFGRQGEVLAQYRKIHLFDAAGLESGSYRESDYIRPGQEIVTWEIDGVTFGTAICYDIRFPEMFRALRLRGVDVITLPAAFTVETGEAHWELLTRARAVETQCHVLSCGLGGHVETEGACKASYGHSLVVDAWGTVVAKAGAEAQILHATLDLAAQADIRNRMQLMAHRRLAAAPFGAA